MEEDEFRLPRSSYDMVRRIIKGYGNVQGPTGPKEVANLIGVHDTQVSRNNKFLVSVGVIEGGRQKSPTQLGSDLARAIEYNKPDDIQRIWHELLVGHDFIDKIRTAVKVRDGMERTDLESHIAYTAGQKKSKGVMTGAGALVDLMLEGGLLKDRDGQLVVPSGEGPEWAEDEELEHGPLPREEVRDADSLQATLEAGGVPTNLAIELQIRCTPDELDDLAPKLREFLKELSQKEAEDAGEGK